MTTQPFGDALFEPVFAVISGDAQHSHRKGIADKVHMNADCGFRNILNILSVNAGMLRRSRQRFLTALLRWLSKAAIYLKHHPYSA